MSSNCELRPLGDLELDAIAGGSGVVVNVGEPPMELDTRRSIRVDRAYRK